MIEAIIAALVVGLSLGVFGSGGAILTLPSLVYFLGFAEKQAVVASLFIVATIAGFTAMKHAVNGRLDKQTVLMVAIPGMLVSVLGAKVAGYSPAWLQLTIFALLMLLAAGKMLTTKVSCSETGINKVRLMSAAGVIGFLTGFVGVGGGFLLVPALIMFAGFSSSKSMIMSSAIVALQSASGFVSYGVLQPELFSDMPLTIVVLISVIGLIGANLGVKLQDKVNQTLLNRFFAIFLIVIASAILIQRWLF